MFVSSVKRVSLFYPLSLLREHQTAISIPNSPLKFKLTVFKVILIIRAPLKGGGKNQIGQKIANRAKGGQGAVLTAPAVRDKLVTHSYPIADTMLVEAACLAGR